MYYLQKSSISENIIDLFHKERYEPLILTIMNLSKVVFPEEYEYVENQSKGECDYLGKTSHNKYDAKLPFLPQQVELLTNGKKHGPLIKTWIKELYDEAFEYQPLKMREDPSFSVKDTKLYRILEKAVQQDSSEENLVFFFPFPVVPAIPHPLLDITSNFLTRIYSELNKDYDFTLRSLYVIHASQLRGVLTLRNLKTRETEHLPFSAFDEYFSYNIESVFTNQ